MAAERRFVARITWKERVDTAVGGVTATREHIREEVVDACAFWKVYRELLDRGVFPEERHSVEVWEVGGGL